MAHIEDDEEGPTGRGLTEGAAVLNLAEQLAELHAKQEGVEAQDGAEASGSNQQEKPEEPTMPAVPPAPSKE